MSVSFGQGLVHCGHAWSCLEENQEYFFITSNSMRLRNHLKFILACQDFESLSHFRPNLDLEDRGNDIAFYLQFKRRHRTDHTHETKRPLYLTFIISFKISRKCSFIGQFSDIGSIVPAMLT